MSFLRLTRSLPFSRFFRQLEQETETVINVLQPGPLGIIEHKFSAEEVREAKAAVDKAVSNWKRNAILEKSSPIMKDHIDKSRHGVENDVLPNVKTCGKDFRLNKGTPSVPAIKGHDHYGEAREFGSIVELHG